MKKKLKQQKQKKLDSKYEDFFSKDKEGWVSGVSAVELEAAAAKEPSAAPSAPTAMDSGDVPRARSAKGSAPGVHKGSLKAVRGQRTKAQKLRKSKQTEKATARADKVVVRVDKSSALSKKKAGLKSIY
ncbi:hypothetical protein TSOC_000661 [Tetrabaena socialis]|uniref:Uncharacterized protein n=1 Tax=Tetrabaena socialis TaxID=47790 RepID=A0A2J8AIN0_9CHLO|nr:hypothetical protein TSOC_000661 [Tetrabaena socialis]|eukprot:PNH12371.1 hypothetical protein TSOC_000661 [Tetrabaena socialis]